MTIMQDITKQRAALVMEARFYGSLAMRLKLEESRNVETMATDGRHLFFNPDSQYLADLSGPKLKGAICHQVTSCVLHHHTRRGARDEDRWNRASDIVVNLQVKDQGFELPDDAVIDERFQGLSIDAVYRALSDMEQDPQEGDDDGDDSSSDGDDSSDDSGSGQDDSQSDSGDGSDDDGDDDSSDDQSGDGDRSGGESGGPPTPDYNGCGAVMDAPAEDGGEASPADMAQQEQEWNTATAQAAQHARIAGQLSQEMDREIQQALYPTMPWEDLLREFMTSNARDDYAWIPPNRRYIHQGIYLPSMSSEEMGPVVVFVDVSGSTTPYLNRMCDELTAICEDTAPSIVHVVYVAASVTGTQEFTRDDYPITITPMGTGGTLFGPAFQWVEDNDIEPECAIYITDMEAGDLAMLQEPDYPVLWARVGSRSLEAPFGDHIDID